MDPAFRLAFLDEAVQEAVDKGAALGGGIELGDFHVLVDRDLHGDFREGLTRF